MGYTLEEAIQNRHSVRKYTGEKIPEDIIEQLQTCIQECNAEACLNLQLIIDEPNAFGKSKMAHYGSFRNVRNYIVVIGKKNEELTLGYYGEKVVLSAQQLELNTCWVGLSYKKSFVPCKMSENEKKFALIALGYGESQGIARKSKKPQQVSKSYDSAPNWFKKGVELALFAPTALNRQKFHFELVPENKVIATTSWGLCSTISLGIAKQHFKIGAGKENFVWE